MLCFWCCLRWLIQWAQRSSGLLLAWLYTLHPDKPAYLETRFCLMHCLITGERRVREEKRGIKENLSREQKDGHLREHSWGEVLVEKHSPVLQREGDSRTAGGDEKYETFKKHKGRKERLESRCVTEDWFSHCYHCTVCLCVWERERESHTNQSHGSSVVHFDVKHAPMKVYACVSRCTLWITLMPSRVSTAPIRLRWKTQWWKD